MNTLHVHRTNQILFWQRNILLIISAVLILSNILLALVSISKQEKTIILPAITEAVTIGGKESVSESFIDRWTIFYMSLLTDLSPNNIEWKSDLLLKHVATESYHKIKDYLKKEQEKYVAFKLNSKFDITGSRIIEGGKEVEVTGIYSGRAGDKEIKDKQVRYRLKLKHQKSPETMLLENFQLEVMEGN